MKQRIKFLGIGLFLAGLLLTVEPYLPIPFLENTSILEKGISKKESDALSEKIVALEKENAELQEAIKKAQSVQQEPTTDNNEPDASENESMSEETVVSGNIYIYESVSLYDIGKQAEDLNIIQNGRELELFLAKPEYSRSIQKGIFELHSGMSLEEMANVLTGKSK